MSTDPTGLRQSPDAVGADATQPAARRRVGSVDEPTEVHRPVEPGADARGSGADAGPADARRPEADRPAPKRRSSRRGRKVRKVHRVVRHLDVWSVAKVAALFAACGYVVGMISGYLLWQAADRVGTIDGIEGFFEDAGGYDSFQILGDVVFRSMAIAGLLLAGLAVFVAVIGAVLFNLISDLTGGIRMTVIDEDLIVAPARRRPPPNGAEAPGRAPSTDATAAATAADRPRPRGRQASDATAAYRADR